MNTTVVNNLSKYLVILECKPEKNQNIQQLTAVLKLKPTDMPHKNNINYFCFEGDVFDYYCLVNSLKSASLAEYFSLIDSGIADNLDFKVLPSSIDEKGIWNFSLWRTQGVPKAAEIVGGWKSTGLSAPSGTQSETEGKFAPPQTELTIAGNKFILNITTLDEDPTDIWYRYELTSATKGQKIPAGFKLRLLNHKGEEFENNTNVAKEATEALIVDVQPDLGEGIIWQTEPLPENYKAQPLWFD